MQPVQHLATTKSQPPSQARPPCLQRSLAPHLQAQHAWRGEVHPHAAVGQVQAVQAGEAVPQLLAGNALGAEVHQQAGGCGLPAAAHQAQHTQRGWLQLIQNLQVRTPGWMYWVGEQAGGQAA